MQQQQIIAFITTKSISTRFWSSNFDGLST